jgi:formylglycine-generating enzyme required for sulfatase activity
MGGIAIGRLWKDMVRVRGGLFRMGATPEQKGYAYANETPEHRVELEDFHIGRYPVTQGQWLLIMDDNPSRFKGEKDLPVDSVSWDDAQAFIERLNAATGGGYRLPTEAEWEFAARGGRSSKGYLYSGGDNVDSVAWTCRNSRDRTHLVGRKRPNEIGLYDMSGNVSEWCLDRFGPYDPAQTFNPRGPEEGPLRVSRGGSWYYAPIAARVSFRIGITDDYRGRSRGFRLVFQE